MNNFIKASLIGLTAIAATTVAAPRAEAGFMSALFCSDADPGIAYTMCDAMVQGIEQGMSDDAEVPSNAPSKPAF